MSARLKELYENKLKNELYNELACKNVNEVPKLEKIVLNMGVGEAASDKKKIEGAIKDLTQISGQKVLVTKAKKSIAGFKLREDIELGITVTLRRNKMYSFLDRLINLALPRIRDFQGLDPNKFDKFGNYTFGLTDQLIFPEIEYEQVDQQLGFNITIVTSAKNPKEGLALLTKMGLPFRK